LKYFSLMLLPEQGAVKSFKLYHAWLYAVAFLFVAVAGFGVWGMSSIQTVHRLSQDLQQAQQALIATRQAKEIEVARLQSDVDLEKDKMSVYAKAIGQLEARLMRLDSLGKHLVEVSSLDKDEFDFDSMPAIGGPLVSMQADDKRVNQRMDSVTDQLSELNMQLGALDLILEDDRENKEALPKAWPSEGGWLSSHFGVRADPFTGEPARHMGIDIANRKNAPVLAASRGAVSFASKMEGFGYLVELDHGFGYQTRYAHLAKANVSVGDVLEQGQKLGEVGSTGRSTGPHLHYEVLHYGVQIDPERYLPKT